MIFELLNDGDRWILRTGNITFNKSYSLCIISFCCYLEMTCFPHFCDVFSSIYYVRVNLIIRLWKSISVNQIQNRLIMAYVTCVYFHLIWGLWMEDRNGCPFLLFWADDVNLDWWADVLHRLEENYEMAEGVCIPRSALYMHYLDFSEKHDTQPVNAASFGKVRRMQNGHRSSLQRKRGKRKLHSVSVTSIPAAHWVLIVHRNSFLSAFCRLQCKINRTCRQFRITAKKRPQMMRLTCTGDALDLLLLLLTTV